MSHFHFSDVLAIHVNGQETFFVNEKILSEYSGKLRKIIKQEKRKTQIKSPGVEINECPGGPNGFELVSRFCYNNGRIKITVTNVTLLHCCAIFLGMKEMVKSNNLLKQTETFLEGIFNWSWNDIVSSLKSCELFIAYADSQGVLDKLIYALLSKLAQNSDISSCLIASPSSSPDSTKFSCSTKQWWFDDLRVLPPQIIKKLIKNLGAYGADNNNLILTKFILHYLKNARLGSLHARSDYIGLTETAVYGVIVAGEGAFSCRGLFSVLRNVSGFGLSKECRAKLERLIGALLDQATLDDLLVSGHERGVYDVHLVARLVRVFVNDEKSTIQKLKKVGKLIDKYLGEIAPDHKLKVSKFLGVAESLPDFARDCFDGVYKAIDIYLESHPTLSFEERSRLCRCLKYEKLTFEACKDLAKNPRIPPSATVQALVSQQCKIPQDDFIAKNEAAIPEYGSSPSKMMVLYNTNDHKTICNENEDLKINIERMQWRVMELEKACREMKGRMSKLAGRNIPNSHSRPLPKLC